jgi:hypothetical protein
MTSKTFRRSVATGAILAAVSLTAAQADDIAYFRDALRPNGHERSAAARRADGRDCGAGPDLTIGFMPAFQKCMSGKGWVLDHYGPDPSAPVQNTVVNFVDVKGDSSGGARGNAVLQADGQACEAPRRDPASAAFQQCMASRGWKYILTQYAPAPRQQPQQWVEWGTTPITSATDDEPGRHSNDAQAASDAVTAASQATADSLAAMQQQMQNDLIRANEPVQQNN